MGQRKRHHLVARFLLKRFAARIEGDKSFIWRLTKDTPPKLLSTKDVAVQSNFYGTEEEGLEAALSDVEGRWAGLLRRIDAGESLAPLADELWHMVYLMAYRASPIRSAFDAMTERLVDHLHVNASSPQIKKALDACLDKRFDDELLARMSGLPADVQQALWESRELLKQGLVQGLDAMDAGTALRDLLAQLQKDKVFPSAAKLGHNKGVTRLIAQASGPEAAKPLEWRLLTDPTGSVVLGDCAVVAIGELSGVPGAPWKFGRDCRAYYMPISPRQVIVGLRHPGDTPMTCQALNTASAELSESSIFSSADTDYARGIAPLIGSRWMPLDEHEMNAILQSVLTDLAGGTANDHSQ